MVTKKSYVGGAPQTTLTADPGAGGLSITVTSGAGYPTGASWPFVIVLGAGTSTEEKVLCDSRTGDTFTVNASGRGYDNTTASAHAIGTTVDHVLDAASLTDLSSIAYDQSTDNFPQYILKTLADANSVLYAVSDNTPAALAMGASTILARLAAGNIVAATPAQLRTLLSLVIGTNVQAWDADLDAVAALTSPATKIPATSIDGAWTAYTPTWAALGTAVSLGNGTIAGAWKLIGSKTLALRLLLTAGSSTTFGTNTWVFGLPAGVTSAAAPQTLTAHGLDSSAAARYSGLAWVDASATVALVHLDGSTAPVSVSVPFAWAQSDTLLIDGVIEIA